MHLQTLESTRRPFQSCEHLTRSPLMCLTSYTRPFFSLVPKRFRITKRFSCVSVFMESLQNLLSHNSLWPPVFIHLLPPLSQHTHTPSFPLFSTLESSFRKTYVLFLMITLILCDQTKIVINFHQGAPLLNILCINHQYHDLI